MNKTKFYQFKNETPESTDLYIYGAITDDKESDWCACESDIDLKDFQDALNKVNKKLNLYVNSPGGSVFASSTMVSMLKRAKEKNKIKVNAYVDGLAASAASFLIMVADEINMYSNSMLMIHKPMSFAWGNADEMQKEIDTLNSIEDNVMIPLYEEKAKCGREKIKELIDAESWLSAEEVDNLFYVNLLDSPKESMACVDSELFKHYKNIPEELINEVKENTMEEEIKAVEPEKEEKQEKLVEEEPKKEEETTEIEEKPEEEEEKEPKQQENVVEIQNIDYSYFENKLNSIKEV